MKRIAIIGSGIAAASLAHALHDFADITVFEKARGVGGRVSTRYQDDFEFDLGAPFFSVTHPSFQTMINDLIHQNIVAKWCYREWGKTKDIQLKAAYLGCPRMNDLSKFLLNTTKVYLEHKVTHLEACEQAWVVYFEAQAPQTFDWVISTAPPSQSKSLLPRNFEYSDLLGDVELKPSIVLLLGLTNPLAINWDCYEINSDKILRCIVNSNKPGRKHAPSVVIESHAGFAQQHVDDHDDSILALLMAEIKNFLPINDSQIRYQKLHRWRYAIATEKKLSNMLCFDLSLGLGVCGDWAEGADVEGAYLSGVRMAHVLRQIILGKKS